MADLESPPLGGFCGGYGLGWVSKFEVRARPLGAFNDWDGTDARARDGLRTKKCSEPGPAGSDGRYIFSQPPSKSGLLAMKCCRGGGLEAPLSHDSSSSLQERNRNVKTSFTSCVFWN